MQQPVFMEQGKCLQQVLHTAYHCIQRGKFFLLRKQFREDPPFPCSQDRIDCTVLLKGIQILGDPALSLHGKGQVDTVSKQKALSVLLK